MGCRYHGRYDNFNDDFNDNFTDNFTDNRVAGISSDNRFDNRCRRCDWVWNGRCWRCQCGPTCND